MVIGSGLPMIAVGPSLAKVVGIGGSKRGIMPFFQSLPIVRQFLPKSN